jgi:hypothetical protein
MVDYQPPVNISQTDKNSDRKINYKLVFLFFILALLVCGGVFIFFLLNQKYDFENAISIKNRVFEAGKESINDKDKNQIISENVVYYKMDTSKMYPAKSDYQGYECNSECHCNFFQDDKYVYQRFQTEYFHKLEGADRNSFEVLANRHNSCSFSKDINHVYYWGKPIDGMDLESFEILNFPWVKDRNSVYFEKCRKIDADIYDRRRSDCELVKVPDSDPASFSNSQFLGKDNNAAYCYYERIPGINNAIINQNILKNDDSVYYCMVNKNKTKPVIKKIIGADPKSFKILHSAVANLLYIDDKNSLRFDFIHARDKNSLFCLSKRISGANPENYGKIIYKNHYNIDTVLYNYIKDDESVYYCDWDYNKNDTAIHKFEEADPSTFSFVIDTENRWNWKLWLKDKSRVYKLVNSNQREILDKIIHVDKADPDTFEIINNTYSKDKNNVFCDKGQEIELIDRADVHSFEDLKYGLSYEYAKDKKNTFRNCDILDKSIIQVYESIDCGQDFKPECCFMPERPPENEKSYEKKETISTGIIPDYIKDQIILIFESNVSPLRILQKIKEMNVEVIACGAGGSYFLVEQNKKMTLEQFLEYIDELNKDTEIGVASTNSVMDFY